MGNCFPVAAACAAYTLGGQDWDKLFHLIDKHHSGAIARAQWRHCVRHVLKVVSRPLWGTLGYSRVLTGTLGYSGVLWGTLRYHLMPIIQASNLNPFGSQENRFASAADRLFGSVICFQ